MKSCCRDALYRRYRFPAEIIAHGRGSDGRLRHRGLPSDDTNTAGEIRASFRLWIRRSSVGRLGDKWHLEEVAIRWQELLVVAGCGQDDYVFDEIIPEPTEHQGCEAIADPATEAVRRCPETDDHRQVAFLRGGQAAGDPVCGASFT
jgi:hypothetical protein